MSLSTSIAAGTLLGAVAAFAVYTATAPGEDAVVAQVAAVVAPVPTPTVTQLADGCEPPAVLTGDECVTTTPGRRIVGTAPAGPSSTTTSAGRTAGDRADADDRDDDDDDHDDDGDDHGGDDDHDDDHDDDD